MVTATEGEGEIPCYHKIIAFRYSTVGMSFDLFGNDKAIKLNCNLLPATLLDKHTYNTTEEHNLTVSENHSIDVCAW